MIAAAPTDGVPCPLAAIETWVFDLDNTLYSSSAAVFPQIHVRMTDFIVTHLGLSVEDAVALRQRYYHEHGTTMRGLMVEDGVDPDVFMDYVHDIDLGVIAPSPRLDAALARLPGRKVIYTNGSAGHAEGVLARLGLARHFAALYDIRAADYIPKPQAEPYGRLLALHGIDPARAIMLDDIPHNLAPAAALGMTTAWIREAADARWRESQGDISHIHHVVADLAAWLEAVPVM